MTTPLISIRLPTFSLLPLLLAMVSSKLAGLGGARQT
jgi:hypothetical protein